MMELFQQPDEAVYGKSGGPREYGEFMGRAGVGGWANEPLAVSDFDGKGVWAQPPAPDRERNSADLTSRDGTHPGNTLFDIVRGWAGDPAAEGGWF